MKLLLDKDGHVVVRNGMPVYVDGNGAEVEFDVVATTVSIAQLKQEARDRRLALEDATAKLKVFAELDPVKAREALEIVSKLDAKKLRDAGEVDAATALLNKGWQEKLDAEKALREKTEQQYIQSEIGGSFARSKFIADKMTVPADMVQATFGKQFKLVEGKIVAHDGNGQPIHSKANPAEIASFDEALEIVVGNYPHKAALLKSTQKGGGGANDKGGSAPGSKIKTRAEFGAMTPAEQHAHVREGGKIVDAAAA